MSGLIVMAVGTRRGKAENWIEDLPGRFSGLSIVQISKEELHDLPPAPKDPDLISILLIDQPYVDVHAFRKDAELAMGKGWEVAFEYFPGEPLILLIQADQRSIGILGAEELRKELQKLQGPEQYESALQEAEASIVMCDAVA